MKKHAQASLIDVIFSYDRSNILLRIIDNGIGFNVEKRRATLNSEKRMGLRIMEKRIGFLGGTF